MLFTYNRLRDGIYLVSILLCLLSFLLNSNDHSVGTDGSLQKVFFSHDENHAKYETLLILFSCATTMGCAFLPNLIMETVQIKTKKEAIDSFLLERYLFTGSFIAPNMIAFCGISSGYKHTADLYQTSLSIFVVTFTYVTTVILEQSAYKNIWTRNVIILNYSMTYFLLTVIVPFFNMTLLKIFGTIVVIINVYYHSKYLLNSEVKKTLSGKGSDSWKESIVVHVCIGNIILNILHMMVIFVFGTTRYNANMYSVKGIIIIQVIIYVILSSIFNTVPRTNLAVSKATSTSLKEFIRQMCHEIRTPLSVARMGLNTIQDMILSLKDILKIPEYLEIKELLYESLEGMDISVEILNEALQMDKIESGLFSCDKVHKNMGSFIRETVRIFHGKCASKNITFDCDIWKENKISRTIVWNKEVAFILRFP